MSAAPISVIGKNDKNTCAFFARSGEIHEIINIVQNKAAELRQMLAGTWGVS